MKKITAERIKDAVKEACLSIQYRYSPKMEETLNSYMNKEESGLDRKSVV